MAPELADTTNFFALLKKSPAGKVLATRLPITPNTTRPVKDDTPSTNYGSESSSPVIVVELAKENKKIDIKGKGPATPLTTEHLEEHNNAHAHKKSQEHVLTSPVAFDTLNVVDTHAAKTFSKLADNSNGNDMNAASHVYAIEHTISERLDAVERTIKKFETTERLDAIERIVKKLAAAETSQLKADAKVFEPLVGSSGTVKTAKWKPFAVRNMAPLKDMPLELSPLKLGALKAFRTKFLHGYLGDGKSDEFANSLYWPALGVEEHGLAMMMPSKSYYIIDASLDPFVPQVPGEHGAKLVVVMRDQPNEEMMESVPLFVALDGDKRGDKDYFYMGHYSQTRWSDKLDYDRMHEVVTEKIKQHWVDKLANKDGPKWQREQLLQTLCAKPSYEGNPMSAGKINGDELEEKLAEMGQMAKEDLNAFVIDILEWEDEMKQMDQTLTKTDVLAAFERSDADADPGLRFWWEYLECVGFDRNFYYMLSQAQDGIQ